MTYHVRIVRAAERELRAIARVTRVRIEQRILALEDNPRPPGAVKLTGMESYRLRVGDYRVLYTIDDAASSLTVCAVGHRREIYRRR